MTDLPAGHPLDIQVFTTVVGGERPYPMPFYSKDLTAAFQLLGQPQFTHWELRLVGEEIVCYLGSHTTGSEARAETVPLAICRAALKASL